MPDTDVLMETIGQVSMCWEHVDRAGAFDSQRAKEIGDNLRQYYSDGIGDFATARRRVCNDMAHDPGLRLGYHANIAMAIFDNSALDIASCNRLADEIMKVIFEV